MIAAWGRQGDECCTRDGSGGGRPARGRILLPRATMMARRPTQVNAAAFASRPSKKKRNGA